MGRFRIDFREPNARRRRLVRLRSVALLSMALLCLPACSDDDPPSNPGGGGGTGDGTFVDPVWEYPHTLGVSVTGGYVVPGTQVPSLTGKYVYGDFGSGQIWALSVDAMGVATNEAIVDAPFPISSFGLGSDGRLLVLQHGSLGRIHRIVGQVDIVSNTVTYSIGPAWDWTFVNPVDLRSLPDGRIFVVEQLGRIRVFDPSQPANAPTTFLDIDPLVTSGGELGLLGLAFHPNFATNGWFFVYYTSGNNPWAVNVARYTVSADPNVADAASGVVLLTIPQQYPNHNGGGLAFDGDGYLLVAVGDEGGAGDPNDNGQDPTTLYGSILRLDVDVPSAPYYAIPPDNPFGDGAEGRAPEIFAYGLRNPWRISYDPAGDRIWAGDVGQDSWEEINLIVAGGNYGWDCREGSGAYTGPPGAPSAACAP